MTSKNFLCTWNYKDNEESGDWMERLKELKKFCNCRYICGQLESGEERERLHIQFFVTLSPRVIIILRSRGDKI